MCSCPARSKISPFRQGAPEGIESLKALGRVFLCFFEFSFSGTPLQNWPGLGVNFRRPLGLVPVGCCVLRSRGGKELVITVFCACVCGVRPDVCFLEAK